MVKENCALVLSALLLAACGGGGGGGSSPSPVISTPVIPTTSITGTVTPPTVLVNFSTILNPPTMLIPPNTAGSWWPAIVQSMEYTFDPVAAAATPPALKATNLRISPVELNSTAIAIDTGAAYPADPTLGQGIYFRGATKVWGVFENTTISTATGAVASQITSAGLPTVILTNHAAVTMAGYVLPYSATLNPAGYTYQTFGAWLNTGSGVVTENYFSTGNLTEPGTLPVAGTASYTGQATGSLVDAATRDSGDTAAMMNATADFGARTVAFSTTGTTSLSINAAPGTLHSANPGLNMSGTLSYAGGSNVFTGAVTTVNGMSGNATGRFYGPGIAVATPTKVVGAPPEIGGTFAVMGTVGAMQGAFGGK